MNNLKVGDKVQLLQDIDGFKRVRCRLAQGITQRLQWSVRTIEASIKQGLLDSL